jgi:hypothetical protein
VSTTIAINRFKKMYATMKRKSKKYKIATGDPQPFTIPLFS